MGGHCPSLYQHCSMEHMKRKLIYIVLFVLCLASLILTLANVEIPIFSTLFPLILVYLLIIKKER